MAEVQLHGGPLDGMTIDVDETADDPGIAMATEGSAHINGGSLYGPDGTGTRRHSRDLRWWELQPPDPHPAIPSAPRPHRPGAHPCPRPEPRVPGGGTVAPKEEPWPSSGGVAPMGDDFWPSGGSFAAAEWIPDYPLNENSGATATNPPTRTSPDGPHHDEPASCPGLLPGRGVLMSAARPWRNLCP
ncbi:hypothetical protein [Streptomyces laurentii]|uniref:hypothetical protein n=1 Tax=Streptomyces laurentii TaxID=39478 RepID=UPI0036921A7B